MQDLGETKSVDREFGETNPGDRLENGSMGKRKFRNTKVRIHELELINRTAENVHFKYATVPSWTLEKAIGKTVDFETGDWRH